MKRLIEKIKRLLKESRREWIELYKLLTKVKNEKIWKEEGFQNWSAFVKAIAADTGVSDIQIYKIMRAGKVAEELEKKGVNAEKLGINKLERFAEIEKRRPELAEELVKSGKLERASLKDLSALAKGEKKEIQKKESEAPSLHIALSLEKRIIELEERLERLERKIGEIEGKKASGKYVDGDDYLDDILGGDI